MNFFYVAGFIVLNSIFCIFANNADGKGKNNPDSKLNNFISVVDIKSEPSQKDWQYFHEFDRDNIDKLWKYFAKQGHNLGDWVWQWRLGWIQVCAASDAGCCREIMESGLFDKAMVVRAEAATKIGEKFSGQKNAHTINLLKKAYSDKRNYRKGKPLFVQRRILHALKSIGGDYAMDTGRSLAKVEKSTNLYWEKISKM